MSFLKKDIKKAIEIMSKEKICPVYVPVYKGDLLKNKVCLISGGGSGIGKAISSAFIENGARVIITGRNEDKLKSVCQMLGENAFYSVMDISDAQTIERSFASICDQNDFPINVLVNCAGVNNFTRFGEISEQEFDDVIETNLKGTFFLSQTVTNYMIRNGIQGNVLNVGSTSSFNPVNRPYGMSKWGIRGLTLGMAKSLIQHGIVVNGIAPGPTATAMLMKNGSSDLRNDAIPAGRYITPEEVANLSVFLCSPMGRMIVGEMICVSGGCGVITFDYKSY